MCKRYVSTRKRDDRFNAAQPCALTRIRPLISFSVAAQASDSRAFYSMHADAAGRRRTNGPKERPAAGKVLQAGAGVRCSAVSPLLSPPPPPSLLLLLPSSSLPLPPLLLFSQRRHAFKCADIRAPFSPRRAYAAAPSAAPTFDAEGNAHVARNNRHVTRYATARNVVINISDSRSAQQQRRVFQRRKAAAFREARPARRACHA